MTTTDRRCTCGHPRRRPYGTIARVAPGYYRSVLCRACYEALLNTLKDSRGHL